MRLNNNFRVGVVSSIIASLIFLIFLQPVLNLISKILFGAGAGVFRFYTDRLFVQAALLTPPDAALNLHAIILTGMLSVITGFLIFRISVWWNPDRLHKKSRDPARLYARLVSFPWGLVGATLFLAFCALALMYSMMFQMRVVSSFKQHMTTIAPYITDQRAKELYSQWTQMRSEEDYHRIYSELDRIAAENHVVLPTNVVFSLKQL